MVELPFPACLHSWLESAIGFGQTENFLSYNKSNGFIFHLPISVFAVQLNPLERIPKFQAIHSETIASPRAVQRH